MMKQEIIEIKSQYNKKLEDAIREHQTGDSDLIQSYESILNLEFEKILLSLKMKSQNMS